MDPFQHNHQKLYNSDIDTTPGVFNKKFSWRFSSTFLNLATVCCLHRNINFFLQTVSTDYSSVLASPEVSTNFEVILKLDENLYISKVGFCDH